jgi:hypothetical protein
MFMMLLISLLVKAQESTINSQIGDGFEIKEELLFFKGNKVAGSSVKAVTSVIDDPLVKTLKP